MLHPEKFVKLGIDPPKGVLCYGPPGTGKTLLARAVANRTDACFIRVIGSELVQKYVGEGARMVRELFQVMQCLSWAQYHRVQQTWKVLSDFCAVLSDANFSWCFDITSCILDTGRDSLDNLLPFSIIIIYSVFVSHSRWLDQRRPALCSLMKLMQLEVLDLMMDWGVTMKFSVLCLKL